MEICVRVPGEFVGGASHSNSFQDSGDICLVILEVAVTSWFLPFAPSVISHPFGRLVTLEATSLFLRSKPVALLRIEGPCFPVQGIN